MKTTFMFSVCLALAALFSGCATPEARINKAPEAFARLTPEQQALVKEGKVAIGFDMDAVKLALGAPDRTWTRTDAAGVREVWSYTTWENDLGQPLYRGWYHRGFYAPDCYYLNYPDRREHEYFKLIFGTDGKVAEIEQDVRR